MKYSISKLVLPSILLLILVQLFSCSAGSCLEPVESQVKATFYVDSTGKALPPDSVTLYGINMDTLKIYDSTKKLATAEFPLYAAVPDCKFVIRINTVYDTIEFRYSNYIHLISKECGYTFFYNVDTVIHSMNAIKSITLVKKTITNLNEENMRIFY